MIRISFNGSDQRLVVALQARGPQLVAAETRTLDRLMLELQAVVQRKLSGEVLKSHAGGGGLLGSVRKTPTDIIGNQLAGAVQAGGGQFWWARVHEFGGEKTYPIDPVNKKALAFLAPGAIGVGGHGRTALTHLYYRLGSHRGEVRPNRYAEFHAAGGVVVKHVEHPPLPKRSFMATALEEMRARIVSQVFKTAAEALR